MRPELPGFPPSVKEDANVRLLCGVIELSGIMDKFYRKVPLTETKRRSINGRASISVDQGKLPLIVGDQILRLCVIAQKMQAL